MKLKQKPILTEKTISNNQRAMDHAIAQQTLEGLAVSREAINDLERAVRGEITTAQAVTVDPAPYSSIIYGKPLVRA